MPDHLIVPGRPAPPEPEPYTETRTETVLGPDGRLYEMTVTGSGTVTRGPLSRFIDLAAQITAEGGTVPTELRDVLQQLAERKEP